jgi:hypothetical protein
MFHKSSEHASIPVVGLDDGVACHFADLQERLNER